MATKKNNKKRPKKNAARSPKVAATPSPGPAAPGSGILARLLNYGEKIYGLCSGMREVKDERTRPQIPAGRVALAYLILMLSRLGSLNALEQRDAPLPWAKWLGGSLPSADVMGTVSTTMNREQLRAILRHQHRRFKRNKGFGRDRNGLRWLILDGHEGVASYRRTWKDCLQRVIHSKTGDRTQSYFRYVAAYLSNGKQGFLLDAEAQLPGEGEVACAIRLLKRLLEKYPRAFDVVCGDNAYMDPKLWQLVRSHNKHIIAVLKNENRDLLVDARSLFAEVAPVVWEDKKVKRLCWDINDFTTWPQCGERVRVVRSLETSKVKRQINKENEILESEWFWVTSLPHMLASTETIIRAGHGRWGIENQGFNELCNQWHGDHAYKYNANALLVCILILFIAYNLFHAFVERNLKPQVRQGRTTKYWADIIAADFVSIFSLLSASP